MLFAQVLYSIQHICAFRWCWNLCKSCTYIPFPDSWSISALPIQMHSSSCIPCTVTQKCYLWSMRVWGWNAAGLQVKQEAWGQKTNPSHSTHQLSLSQLKQTSLWVNQFPVTRTEFSVPRLSLQLPALQLYKGIQHFCYLKIKATLQPLRWVN